MNNSFKNNYIPKFKDSYITINELYLNYINYINNNQMITCKGWIQNSRKQANNLFIKLYDGSCSYDLQIILNIYDNNDIQNLHTGSTIEVKGIIVKSPAKEQLFEMVGKEIKIIGIITEPSIYLPCVKGIKIENLRNKAYIRTKFQSMRAIYRIRNIIIHGLHKYFKNTGCYQVDPNIITTSDCEGAGEVFTITTLLNEKSSNIDFSKDFFKKHAYLTVSSQLQLEALCNGMGKVYTMNPSFRAEPSLTNRHVACFTHVEWELAFIDMNQLLDFNEDIIMFVINFVLENGYNDLEILDKFISPGIISKLKNTIKEEFVRITYCDALNILNLNIHLDNLNKNENFKIPIWGDDLGSICERYLTDIVFKKPVLVYNYPKDLKSFYMKQNDDNPRTVQSCDLLMPKIGEIIGSSIREENYDNLINIMNEKNMKVDQLQWYLDIRKNGTFPHGGAGLGLDRLVAYCTFIEGSIRDVIPFPVAFEMLDY